MPTSLNSSLKKCPTGISGFDELSEGGLPLGRPTLVAGQAGAGKTLFGIEFILNGIDRYQEAGVFVSFEEASSELAANVSSLGFDLEAYQSNNLLRILHIALDPDDLMETGEYDLAGIFIRLGDAIAKTGAKRIVLDAVENLFSAFTDLRTLRTEFRRLINWLKEQDITAIVTTERGTGAITRNGIEEYIADCVVTLDNRIEEQVATRRLRIVKYRGTSHGSDECPFIINKNGFSVLPITSAGLTYEVCHDKVSTGIESLDEMLGGGVFRGSSLLVSGTAGTGKSSVASQMIDAACRRGETCLYIAVEESPEQIERNMRSIGIDLTQWRKAGLLHFHASRPTSSGLETHLATVFSLVSELQPKWVVIDPISAFSMASDDERVKLMLIRAVDLFKSKGITSMFTSLNTGITAAESTAVGISSLMDVWFLLRNLETAGERTRGLYVCKARGMEHSNQIREFTLSKQGVKLVEVQVDESGQVLTGSARKAYLALREQAVAARSADASRQHAVLENRRKLLDARIAAMRAEYEDEIRLLETDLLQEKSRSLESNRMMANLSKQRNILGSNA